MNLLRLGFSILSLGLAFAPMSWAKVMIDPSFTGTLIITLENGDVSLYESGDALPEIPQNATLEVFNGTLTLRTESGDQVQMGCFGSAQAVGGGGSATLSCEATTGKLTVDGGQEYSFSSDPSQEAAAPTAATEQPGTPADQDAQPDPRSIQASIAS